MGRQLSQLRNFDGSVRQSNVAENRLSLKPYVDGSLVNPSQITGVGAMRDKIMAALNKALEDGNTRRVSTLRLILEAIKERDVAARAQDRCDGAREDEIFAILRTMVRQRDDAAVAYEESGRLDLAEQERTEIEIIQTFLPAQLSDDEIACACQAVVEEMGATALRDMGRCMGALKQRFAGKMDFTKASCVVRGYLTVPSVSPRL